MEKSNNRDIYPSEVLEILDDNVTLENGIEAPIVSEIVNSSGFRFVCNICRATVSTINNLYEHIRGNRHARSLIHRNSFPLSRYRKIKIPNENDNAPESSGDLVELAPGEPVPPGFEDEMHILPQISGKLQQMVSPLLGLEFLAEVTPDDPEAEPRYVCILCDKKGDKRTVLAHLISFNHRIRYLGRFFPRALAAFEAIPKLKEYRRSTGEILSRVARAIEDKLGRLNPVIIEDKDFEKNKETLFQTMMKGKHFVESSDCEFEKIVSLDEIKRLSKESDSKLLIDEEVLEAKRLSATPKTSFKHRTAEETQLLSERKELKKNEPELVVLNDAIKKDVSIKQRGIKRPLSGSVSPISSLSSRSRSRSRSRYRSPRRRMPVYRRTRSRSRSRSRSRTYRRRYSPYRRSPCRSPERRRRRSPSFVANRPVVSFKVKSTPSLAAKELEAEAAKNEKIRQFQVYSKALTDEMNLKMKMYEKTPEKHPQYSEEWKKFWNKRYKELTAEGKDASKYDFKPEWIKFWTQRNKELNDEEVKSRIKSFRAELGLSEGFSDCSDDEIMEIPIKINNEAETEVEQQITVIHVLRLLAALEDQLGSLGPKVNNLLSEAVALEKIKKGNSESLLDRSDNVVLFETTKEKLKGQLFAFVIERHLVKGTKKAISAVVDLLGIREKREHEAAAVKELSAEPLVVPGVGAVDKMAIAEQIATALVAQGRTDLSESDLEQLINAVVGMAQVNQAVKQVAETVESPRKGESSKLQELLSFVVQTQSDPSKVAPNSLSLLQNYGDVALTAPTKDMSQLNDNDLKMLLQNFENLSRDEQQFLMKYLKENDKKEIDNIAPLKVNDNPKEDGNESKGRLSPFSSRIGGANPSNIKSKSNFEDDEDDYSYEDIFKAAKKNVKREAAAKKNPAASNVASNNPSALALAAKKQAGKNVAENMIKDQEKKMIFNRVVPAPAVTKPSVLIDPNDLFPTMKTSAPTTLPQSLHSSYTDSTSGVSVANNDSRYDPHLSNIPIATHEPLPQWNGYSYETDTTAYNYQQGSSYGYSAPGESQQYQSNDYSNTWTEQSYETQQPTQQHDPYAPTQDYNYHNSAYETHSSSYPPPTSQYHSYY